MSANIEHGLTVGQVMDTNDPQQMGRLRIFCPALGDHQEMKMKDIPWSLYVSPFGGVTNYGVRGPSESEIEGTTAYGMWNVPKVGAYALVGCIDGDRDQRFWIGCIQPQFMTHTMPHGRYLWNQNSKVLDDPIDGKPDGPYDNDDKQIQPLYEKMTSQFTSSSQYVPSDTPTSDPRKNMEWRTRGSDFQVSALDIWAIASNSPQNKGNRDTPSVSSPDFNSLDDNFNQITEENGDVQNPISPGYGINQQEPDVVYSTKTGNKNFDPMIYSWTTPGFHSISMDDRSRNGRIRMRTTTGHQIILDDTNERIYINTSGGETWIELDSAGNIDIYASKDISTHAQGDISFTSDKTFRVQAKEGIHMVTDSEMRLHAKDDMHIKTNKTLYLTTKEETHINTGTVGYWTTGNELHHKSGGNQISTAPQIHFNGPAAAPATSSFESFIATRIPEHEPWPRVYSDPSRADKELNNSFKPMPDSYASQDIGKKDRTGADIPRNQNWHR